MVSIASTRPRRRSVQPGMRTGSGTDRRHAGLFWTLAERGRAAMEHNPDLDALAAMHRGRVDCHGTDSPQPRDARTIPGIVEADRRATGKVSAKATSRPSNSANCPIWSINRPNWSMVVAVVNGNGLKRADGSEPIRSRSIRGRRFRYSNLSREYKPFSLPVPIKPVGFLPHVFQYFGADRRRQTWLRQHPANDHC